MEKRNTAVGPQISAMAKRPNSRILCTLVIATIIVGMTSATQMFAHAFAYQQSLGSSFHHLYAPWQIGEWIMAYHNIYPGAVRQAVSAGSMAMAALMMIPFLWAMVLSNKAKSNLQKTELSPGPIIGG